MRVNLRQGERRHLSEINVTPLVDVTLVLLIIFMVTAPLLESGTEVKTTRTASIAPGEDRIVLTLTLDLRIFLDGMEVPREGLASTLETLARSGRGKALSLQGDPRVPYGAVIEVLDIVKASGIEVIGLLAPRPGKLPLAPHE